MTTLNHRLAGGYGQCTSKVMRDPAVCLRDKAVYAYLCTFADSKSNQLRVSVHKMAAELDISSITVIRSLKSLENDGVIKRVSIGKGKAKITIILK